MSQPADLLLRNAVVHPLAKGNARSRDAGEAVAVRDGEIVAVGPGYDVGFLAGLGTDVIDLDGRHLLPGFVDAHTHLEVVGRREREADLAGVDSPEGCLDRLRGIRDERPDSEWVLGFGYDESRWDGEYLGREDLETVSDERPVAAFREDLHLVSLNSVAIERYRGEMPDCDVHTAGGEPTGVVVEDALEVVWGEIRNDPDRTREYLEIAQRLANRRGVTSVHEMVRHSHAPRIYRDLDSAGTLTLRVRLNYWADHLDAVLETGLRTNHGSDRLQVGGIKTYVDGSIGSRTARLSEPYADTGGEPTDRSGRDESGGKDSSTDDRGEWVVPPAKLESLVERADEAGLQVAMHAIGDEAITAALDALEGRSGRRHRIEHAEVLTDDLIDRLATTDVVVSVQPNFLKWAGEGGLYEQRLGDSRRRETNRLGRLAAVGARLAFGSDCMPLDPLAGIEEVVTAPESGQRLPVTDALRAYTSGGAYAGYDEGRIGAIETGRCADLVALTESPWESDAIGDIGVDLTVVGGDVVYDGR